MKTYTLEEAAKMTLPALFDEALGDEGVFIVKGDKSVQLWPLTSPGQPAEDAPYTEEELAVFRAFEEVSVKTSLEFAQKHLAE